MLKRTLAITLLGSHMLFTGSVIAEDRSAVLERIKPIGTVTVAGQKPATPAPVVEAAAAPVSEPASTPAPQAPVAVAEAAPAAADGQKIYTTACFACHATGAAGAPKLGDKAAWGPRLGAGKDALVASVLNGKGAMPPKGGQMHLTDADISAAVDYMLDSVK